MLVTETKIQGNKKTVIFIRFIGCIPLKVLPIINLYNYSMNHIILASKYNFFMPYYCFEISMKMIDFMEK